MKKSLVITLALVFVLGIAGTAFAAANPFVDVPAKHWAYDAVTKLAQAGIVDGYGDGTFRGDKTMTRYEMAQIVAKAMTRSDKANAETKALVDKLAVEFNAELQNLGVRVAKLEKEQPNLKFNGNLAIRYKATDYDNKHIQDLDNNTAASYRLRLEGLAKVDEKTSFGMRFVTQAPDTANFGNTTWVGFGAQSTTAKLDRIFVDTKIGIVNTTIGRQALKFDPFDILVDSAAFSFDGVKFAAKTGVVDVTVQHGRLANGVSYTLKDVSHANAVTPNTDLNDAKYMDINSIYLGSKYGKLNYGAGYLTIKNNHDDIDLMKTWHVNGSYLFNNKFSLGAEYAKNTEADDHDNFWAAKAIYGDQVLAAKGQSNFVAQYSDIKGGAVFNRLTTLDTPNIGYMSSHWGWTGDRWDDYKVLDLNYNYAFSKNLGGQLQWVKVDDTTCDVFDYTYFKATLTAKF